MIKTKNNKIYTGISTDVERRFNQHLSGKGGAKFFRGNPPRKIVYTKKFSNRSKASIEEYRIKQLSRKEKETLISEEK